MVEAAPIAQAMSLSAERQKLLERRISGLDRAATTSNSRLTAQPRPAAIPLSFAQERMWLLERIEAVGAAYNVLWEVRLGGSLDVEVLEQCFLMLERRHESLRTRFIAIDGEPSQVIDPPGRFRLVTEDLSELDPDAHQGALRKKIRDHARAPFDLSRGPLLRAKVLRLNATEYLLLVAMHHIVADGWSITLLHKELGSLYAAFTSGRPPALPQLSVQYVDYALWQRDWLKGIALDQLVAYWRDQLAGAPPALELPTDRPRPAVQSFAGAAVGFMLPTDLASKLQELGRSQGATLFMVLLAAFQLVLSRLSGQEDIVVGTPIAGRMQPETQGLIGLFMNTLALRTDLSGDPSFRSLLTRVKQTALGAYAHQDLPFEKLVEALQPVRDLSRQPIFQVLLALQNTPQAEGAGGGPGGLPDLRVEQPTVTSSKLDLSLYVRHTARGLRCRLEYATDLFERATIQGLSEHFATVLNGVVEDPDRQLSATPVLSEDECQRILTEWNQTAAAFPSEMCLHDLVAAQVARTPDATALVYRDRTVTYAELERRSNQLAHHLRGLGVGPETLVALCLQRSAETVIALLGILKAGAAYLPLEPNYPVARLAYMVTNARASALITQVALQDRLPRTAIRVLLDADREAIDACSINKPITGVRPDNLAYVIYTSGSTSQPKGVMITHGALVNFLTSMAQRPGLNADAVVLAVTPISFDIAATELYLPLLVGGRVHLLPSDLAADGLGLKKEIAAVAPTMVQATPASWRLLRDAGWHPAHLRALCGGEALTRELAEFLQSGSQELWNLYGPTETTVWSTACRIEASGPVSIGRPIQNTQVYVLDASMQPVPVGRTEELYIGGAGLARGYLGRPGLTAAHFVPSPFAAGERLYRTGDLARWRADGQLEFVGRVDQQVKIRGVRVEPAEIETALCQAPGVRAAAVLAREDRPGERRLVGYVVTADGTGDARALRAYLQSHLPDYMVPSAILVLETLPLTANGKLDRSALPASEERPEIGAYVPAQTALQVKLAAIWTEVLQLDRVGIDDDFFELGGHSLLATRVIARLRETFSVELPLRALFEAPTIRQLAQRIEAAQQSGAGVTLPPLVAQQRPARLPLSYAQERLWRRAVSEPHGPAYHITSSAEINGPLDLDALEQSLITLVRRHESLRTRFITIDNEPAQIIEPAVAFRLERLDVSSLSEPERMSEARQLADTVRQRPFDLTVAPLFRAGVIRVSALQHIAMLVTHHIVTDGWSSRLLLREILQLYAAMRAGRPLALPPLDIQYSDYALWQRQNFTNDSLAVQLEYWQRTLAGATALTLPTDRARPPTPSFKGATAPFNLAKQVTDALRLLANQKGVTLFMLLLASYAVVLRNLSGQSDILLGTPVAGRHHRALEPLIGLFMNMLPMRVFAPLDANFTDLLLSVRETALGAYSHQDVPLGLLEAELGRPLFHMLFALQPPATDTLALPDLRLSGFQTSHPTARRDQSLFLTETPDGLRGGLEYSTDLFDAATIARQLTHFHTVLETVVRDREVPIMDLLCQ